MNNLTKSIPLSILFVFLAGCATTGDLPNYLTVEEEKRLGAELSKQVEEEETLLKDIVIQDYIDTIGERIARQSPRQDVEYKFSVIDAPDTVNAFALPGGHMYIYTGLLNLCQNEAELASVMAHEIAHVAAEHHGEALTRQYNMQQAMQIIFGEEESAASTVAMLAAGVRNLSFSRAQERESDQLGMEMMWRAGYKPDAMVDFMARMGQNQAAAPGALGRALVYVSSHPPTENRVDALMAQLNRYPADARANSPVYRDRYVNTIHKRLPKPAGS